MKHPFATNSLFYRELNSRPVALRAERLPPDIVAAAQAHGRARTLLVTLDEVRIELLAGAA